MFPLCRLRDFAGADIDEDILRNRSKITETLVENVNCNGQPSLYCTTMSDEGVKSRKS